MKLGIHGRPGSGRQTVFEALGLGLKAGPEEAKARRSGRLAVVQMPDARLDRLSAIFRPAKTTPIRLTFVLPEESGQAQALAELSALEALLLVVRNFSDLIGQPPRPAEELRAIEEEFILRDLGVVENRLERLVKDRAKGQAASAEEERLLRESLALLEEGRPIRQEESLARAPELKPYAFLSAKPRLVLLNSGEAEDSAPDLGLAPEEVLLLKGKIEQELAQLEPEDAADFRREYGLGEPGLDRVVRACFGLLGLISFFTVGQDECRAWDLRHGSSVLAAAGTIHSDMAKGFIRAEVSAAEDLLAAGSLAEARKRGLIRLEGRDYLVQDGDVLTIRFNL